MNADDRILWQFGENVAKAKSHKTTWELDFLRGMHEGTALAHLVSTLKNNTGHDILARSIWLDKFAWASWKEQNGKPVTKRELADLAIIIRKHNGRKTSNWMWLQQAKRVTTSFEKYSGTSSPYEMDLFHRMPTFNLLNNPNSVPFNLQNDFPKSEYIPWTFLDFHDKSGSFLTCHSPISPRWPAEKPPTGSWADKWMTNGGYPDSSVSSYTDCLCSIINNVAPNWIPQISTTAPSVPSFIPGAPISSGTEWQRLYIELLRASHKARTGHAVSPNNPSGSAFQEYGNIAFLCQLFNNLKQSNYLPNDISIGNNNFSMTIPGNSATLTMIEESIRKQNDNELPYRQDMEPPPPEADKGYENEKRDMQVLIIDAFKYDELPKPKLDHKMPMKAKKIN